MATQTEQPIQYVPNHRDLGDVHGPSFSEKIKDTYHSLEALVIAKVELNKARVMAMKPAVKEGIAVGAVANALLMTAFMSLAFLLSSIAQEAWGWSARGAWALTFGVMVLAMVGALFLLKNVSEKGKTTWKQNQ